MAVGTCIDKVKVGYVFMQLFLKRDFENDLNKMNAIIKMVEDISAQRILFDQDTGQFIHVASAIQDGEGFEHVDKRRAILLQVMNRESESDFEQDELTRILYNEELQKSMKKDELEQYLAEKLIEKHPTMRSLRIGDDVEDILNLAYELLGTDFHKIDMRYKSCCSLIDTKKSAAIAYITDIIENKKD